MDAKLLQLRTSSNFASTKYLWVGSFTILGTHINYFASADYQEIHI